LPLDLSANRSFAGEPVVPTQTHIARILAEFVYTSPVPSQPRRIASIPLTPYRHRDAEDADGRLSKLPLKEDDEEVKSLDVSHDTVNQEH
jgi:hypothetical protein